MADVKKTISVPDVKPGLTHSAAVAQGLPPDRIRLAATVPAQMPHLEIPGQFNFVPTMHIAFKTPAVKPLSVASEIGPYLWAIRSHDAGKRVSVSVSSAEIFYRLNTLDLPTVQFDSPCRLSYRGLTFFVPPVIFPFKTAYRPFALSVAASPDCPVYYSAYRPIPPDFSFRSYCGMCMALGDSAAIMPISSFCADLYHHSLTGFDGLGSYLALNLQVGTYLFLNAGLKVVLSRGEHEQIVNNLRFGISDGFQNFLVLSGQLAEVLQKVQAHKVSLSDDAIVIIHKFLQTLDKADSTRKNQKVTLFIGSSESRFESVPVEIFIDGRPI